MKDLQLNRELWIKRAAVSKETLDIILCHLLKRKILAEKAGTPLFTPHWRIITLRRAFKMKNHIILVHPKGSAWCLLKTQYAKKPKNPV
ncbi:MAG: hypothetical protein K2X37_09250 [Chitinophagaceae bacterium]|jgi:hypothetical protein|nr:hypothetical protein [Chitinophagaceae bacterium]